MELNIPNTHRYIHPGDRIKLGRFDSVEWVVCYGWYSWGDNRPVCGWYLTCKDNPSTIKPLQLPDLQDIYYVES